MAAGGIHAGRGCNPQSENGKRAVGDAGPYGGIGESAPVSGGAPMRAVGDAGPYGVCPSGCGIAPPEAWKKNDAGRRGRRPLRGSRPETWRDTCGRGVPIGGVQTRDAGAGGVFRRAVIDRCGPSGRRIQNYVGCKALPLHGAREESFRAGRGSGSGDRGAGDSVRNLFAPQLQLDEREIQKPSVFGGVLFHISFAVERNMAAGGRKAGRGCNPQSENRKRAVGDAGPYGGIDESASVFEGAPMRAVGDAGPYGGIDESAPVSGGAPMRAVGDAGPYGGSDESAPVSGGAPMRAVGDAGPYGGCGLRHGEISVGGVCPLGAFKRGTQERVAFSGGL